MSMRVSGVTEKKVNAEETIISLFVVTLRCYLITKIKQKLEKWHIHRGKCVIINSIL